MAGIVVIVSRDVPNKCEALLHRMMAIMQHESLDVSGLALFPDDGIYAGWVAQPHSFAAQHSGYDETLNMALIFSGECFEDDDGVDSAAKSWIIGSYDRQGEHFFDDTQRPF